MQRIDSLTPAPRPRAAKQFSGLVNNIPRPAAKQATRPAQAQRRPAPVIDNVLHPQRLTPATHDSSKPHVPVLRPVPTEQQPRQTTTRPIPKPATKHRRLATLKTPLLLLGLVLAGLLLQSDIAGQIMIAAYGIFALIARIPSKVTFTLAFLTFISIAVLLTVRAHNGLAANFAIYAFLLLAIGAIALGREMRGVRA